MIDLRVYQGECTNVARIMVSIFIKQSHMINLEWTMDITKLPVGVIFW